MAQLVLSSVPYISLLRIWYVQSMRSVRAHQLIVTGQHFRYISGQIRQIRGFGSKSGHGFRKAAGPLPYFNPFSALTPDDDDDPEEDPSVPPGVEINPLSNPPSKSTIVMNPLPYIAQAILGF